MQFTKRILGRTGLQVGPLGVASSYGADSRAFEEAFERGCNYFYWGSRRTEAMARAIRNISGSGKRDDLIIVVQSYARSAFLMEHFFRKALGTLDLDRADILLFGWHNKPPAQKLIDKAMEMKDKGLFRFLALSGHNRPLFPLLAEQGVFDVFHVRYNAAHRGAESEVFPYLNFEGRQGLVTYTATRWANLLDPGRMPPGERLPSASDCYRFALSNPSVDVCTCGPKDLHQMREALRTIELGPLSREEMDWMGRVGEHVHSHSKKLFWAKSN